MKTLDLAFAILAAASSVLALPTMQQARILMGQPGHILLANYDGSNFNVALNETVSGSPSWMAFAEPDRLYAVDENSNTLRQYTLDLKANKLELKHEVNGSSGVVHLEFNKDKTRMVGAAYGNGTIDVWNTENGGLELIKTIDSPGALGPIKDRQEAAHPHQAVLDPSGRYFVVNDLGTDSLIVLDSKDDAFQVVNRMVVNTGGCGPRHGVFYPRNAAKATHYMVACELTNVVHSFGVRYTNSSLRFSLDQTISSFGHDAQPKNATTAALGEIILARNNKDLYVSNRLTGDDEDNIAHFNVNASECGKFATLSYVGTVSSGGQLPRMFGLGKGEDVVFAGNQQGKDGLVALKRMQDGSLQEKPLAGMEATAFGEVGFGPQFVKHIA